MSHIWTLLTLAAIIILPMAIWSRRENLKKEAEAEKERQIKREAERNRIAEEKKIRQNRRNELFQSLVDKYGNPDKSINFGDDDMDKEIHVFANPAHVWLFGKDFAFSDIIACEVVDDSRTIVGKTTYTTKSDPIDTLGKMDGASLLWGRNTGNILGAATAEKKTVVTKQPDKRIENYYINVTVNDLSNPIIKINTKYKSTADEVSAVFGVILHRNQGTLEN